MLVAITIKKAINVNTNRIISTSKRFCNSNGWLNRIEKYEIISNMAGIIVIKYLDVVIEKSRIATLKLEVNSAFAFSHIHADVL